MAAAAAAASTIGLAYVTRAGQQLALFTARLIRRTCVPVVMPVCMLQIVSHRAMSACGFARRVSASRPPCYAKQTRHLCVLPVMQIFTLQTRWHAATSASPILPISGCLYGAQAGHEAGETEDQFMKPEGEETIGEEDEEEVDDYLDIVEFNSRAENQYSDQCNQQHYGAPPKSYGGDSVVPIQYGEGKDHQQRQQPQYHNFQLGLEYEPAKAAYSYDCSISQSVSMSSMDGVVVPESTTSEISVSHQGPPKGTIDLFSSPPIQMPSQLSPMEREARVLRYREKKKARKFEKTIRYASRKAYAETRPRIKGRFAKRTDVDVEVDQMFSSALMAETGYGIVPSF
ncbi:ZINC FINGER PROTEIN CONSTANS-LIKE 1 [Salix viminalis]|uniref:ZINC FINGER PROTEIN CONSTANS-LIKE 1 n=1 Tax=Salix viminalis TaxID=40686 RepID=A0A9Q0PAC0_SALVM|nr:ZINC FINGER PROTEIN CONSTANS-LIKE 1 [Salix viminalis]